MISTSTGENSMHVRRLAVVLFFITALLTAHSAAASSAWTLISASASSPAPNWSPPDQGNNDPEPALGDLNGDGKPDLLFGLYDGTLTAYENTGTGSAPVWTAAPASWTTLSTDCSAGGSNTAKAPALADLDGDGLLDLVIGTRGGVCVYHNTGSASSGPIWTRATGWETGLSGLTTNRFYVPTLADLDGDGKIDLMLGRSTGDVVALKNTGTANTPAWTAHSAWDVSAVSQRTWPALADLDGDGKVDLLIADKHFDVFAFKNIGTPTSPDWRYAPAWSPVLAATSTTLPNAGLAAGDLNGDGKPDLLYSTSGAGFTGPTAAYEHNPAGMPDPGFASGTPPAAGGTTVIDTFDSFSCPGAWQAAAGGLNSSYTRDCGNGWTAYAEDVYNNGSGNNAVVTADSSVNGPSAAAGTSLGIAHMYESPDSSTGQLWLMKTFPVVPDSTIADIKGDFRVGINANDRTNLGMVVFDGIVTNPSGEVFRSTLNGPDIIASDIVLDGPSQGCGSTPCPWQTADLTNIRPTHSYITVAFYLSDIRSTNTPYIDMDNLVVSDVVNEVPVSLPTGNIAQLWKADYQAPGTNSGGQASNSAEPKAVKADAAGNVYVVGDSYNGQNYDIVTFKYGPSGNLVWSATYDGGSADQATALALDGSGNVYVTGRSYNTTTSSDDYVAVKYDSTGTKQWSATYDYLNRDDVPAGLAVDGSGNVYVTGSSCNGSTDCKIATVKLGSAGTAWQAIYDNGGAATVSTAAGIGVDTAGKVYVAGSSRGSGSDAIVALKYDAAGAQLRVNRYQGGGDIQAQTMVTDGAGDVYIAGSTGALGGNVAMLVLKYAATAVDGDPPQWVRQYTNGYETRPAALALDAAGNVYVTGSTGSPGDHNFITVKYLTNGDQAWAQTFGNSGRDDRATAVAVDAAGNVYVAGSYNRNTGNNDSLLLKYDSSGVARGAIAYDGYTVNDAPVGLVLNVDSGGDTAPVMVSTSTDATTVDHIDTVGYEKAWPDLTVTAVSGPTSTTVGDTISVDNTVLNISDLANKKHVDSGTFTVGLYLAPNVSGSADLTQLTALGTRNVANLTPGQSSTDTTSVTIPKTVTQGSYFLVAKADINGTVTEADETNNQLVSVLPITVAASDLVISDLQAPTSVTRDVAFDVTTTVTNLVSSPTPAATSFRVGIYLSTDPTITTSDILIGSRTISSLAGFASDTATTSVTIPSSTVAAGTYYIGAIADDQNAIVEKDETNNAAVLQKPAGNSALLTSDTDFSPGLSVTGTADVAVIGTGAAASVQLSKDSSSGSLAWQPQSGWTVSGPVFGLGDLDGDGLPDLLVGSGNANSDVYVYKNTGTASAPAWTEETGWEITGSLDCNAGGAGEFSQPRLADFNGDGVPDMVVADRNGICLYQNTGTASAPAWSRNTGWETGLTALPTNKFYSVAAADLNGDGLVDLMIGNGRTINAYMNTGTSTTPAWTAQSAWDSPTFGTRVRPALGDLDGDGKYDLMVGPINGGTLYGYRNTGTTSAPVWTAVTAWNVTGFGNAGGAPALGDLNGDGRIDMLVASSTNQGFANVPPYYGTGTYVAPVIDAGIHGGYTTLSYVPLIPSNTTLTVDIRAGDVANTSDPSWTTWLAGVPAGGDISALGTHRYVQYRLHLGTSDPLATAELDSIEANKLPPGPQYSTVSVVGGGSGGGGGALGIFDALALILALAGRTWRRR